MNHINVDTMLAAHTKSIKFHKVNVHFTIYFPFSAPQNFENSHIFEYFFC